MSKSKTTSPKSIGKQTVSKTKKVKIKTGPNKRGKSEASKATQFKPGNKLGGRPLGSRNKFAEKFLSDFLSDWQSNGAKAIQDVREKDPSTYLRVGASLVPKELNVNEHDGTLEALLEQYSIEELDNLIAGLERLGAGANSRNESGVDKAQDQAQTRDVTDSIH